MPDGGDEADIKRFIIRVVCALAALVCTQSAASVSACSCYALPTPYKAFREARAVFTGKVTGFTNIPYDEQERVKEDRYRERRFRFAVEESLKGIKGKEVLVTAAGLNTGCYQDYTVGESYLVYAYGESDSSTRTCAAARPT